MCRPIEVYRALFSAVNVHCSSHNIERFSYWKYQLELVYSLDNIVCRPAFIIIDIYVATLYVESISST